MKSLEKRTRTESKKARLDREVRDCLLNLAKQLIEARKAKHFTQRILADRVGVSQSVIARIETGKHNMSVKAFIRMAIVLGKRVVLVDIKSTPSVDK